MQDALAQHQADLSGGIREWHCFSSVFGSDRNPECADWGSKPTGRAPGILQMKDKMCIGLPGSFNEMAVANFAIFISILPFLQLQGRGDHRRKS
jgi:hypothetical protein